MHIIGAGRVGGALSESAIAHGQPCTLWSRGMDLSSLHVGDGPVLVATRNNDLADVLRAVPANRHTDVVFVQNGMLRPWLAEAGVSDATRGLLFFAVPARGAPIQPGPPSPFVGPHAAAAVAFLTAIGVPAEVVSTATFTNLEHEKLLWNSCFGLLCQAYNAPVGVIVRDHASELAELVAELDLVARLELDVSVTVAHLIAALSSYSMTIPDYQGAVKEWAWRNGWYVQIAEKYNRTMPVHARLCALAGV
jgi:ketopantoate reductase